MSEKTFRERIREWRGKRRQKEAAEILHVNIRTLQAWEYGLFEPRELALAEITRRMEANPEKVEGAT